MTADLPCYPRLLVRTDIRDAFESGAKELDDWLQRNAFQNKRANAAITYVSCIGNLVVGYYVISVGAVENPAPTDITKGKVASYLEAPAIVIPRLAVDRNHQGSGLGSGLLRDALQRAALLSDSVGAKTVLLHARDAASGNFYESNLDVYSSPVEDLHLMLPIRYVKRWFGSEDDS